MERRAQEIGGYCTCHRNSVIRFSVSQSKGALHTCHRNSGNSGISRVEIYSTCSPAIAEIYAILKLIS